MARNQNQTQPADRAKVRVFYGEADGSSQSIQDLVRLLGVVVRPPQHTMQHNQTAALPAPSSPGQVAPVVENRPLFDGLESAEADVPDGIMPESEGNGKQRRRRGQGDKVDRNVGIVPMADLDFIPDGKAPLKDFFADTDPTKDQDQVLVIAYYLQFTTEEQAIGPGHILAGFRHVGRPVPVDLKATIRNLKKKVWLNFDNNLENIRVATEGVNRAEHTLAKQKVKPR